MRFRISDGYSRAVEFEADSLASFIMAARCAHAEISTGYLHVQTDYGEWVTTTIAPVTDSVTPFKIFNETDFERAKKAKYRQQYMAENLKNIVAFCSRSLIHEVKR